MKILLAGEQMIKADVYLIILFIMLIPSTAFAHGQSGWMFIIPGHLVLGNALIGFIEGKVLAKYFEIEKQKPIRWFILANYVSSWIAYFGPFMLIEPLLRAAHLPSWLGGIILGALIYIMLNLLMFPFVLSCFKKNPDRFRISAIVTLIIQTTIFLPYFLAISLS